VVIPKMAAAFGELERKRETMKIVRYIQYLIARLVLFKHPLFQDAEKYRKLKYKIENSSSFVKPNRASFRGEIERQRRKGKYPLRQDDDYFRPLEDFADSKMKWNQVIQSLEIPNLHVPKIIDIYDSIHLIRPEDLPERFVLKPNRGHSAHGVGGFIRISGEIFHDIFTNSLLTWEGVVQRHEANLKKFKSALGAEVIIEEMLDLGQEGKEFDWKFIVCGGELAAFFATRKEPDGSGNSINLYFANWNRHKERMPPLHNDRRVDDSIELPENIDAMIEIAKEVATSFARTTCRIDLYEVNGRIYFGEYTPAPGGHYRAALEQDRELGELWEIADAKFNLMVLTRLIESGHPKIGRGIWRV
jgi:hypothetical protein